MPLLLRKVNADSAATAVRIVNQTGGTHRNFERVGSSHTAAELAALTAIGRDQPHPDQRQRPSQRKSRTEALLPQHLYDRTASARRPRLPIPDLRVVRTSHRRDHGSVIEPSST